MPELETPIAALPELEPLPDQAGLTVVLVYLQPDSLLAWKVDRKGARWHCNRRSLDEVAAETTGELGRHVFEYVDVKT